MKNTPTHCILCDRMLYPVSASRLICVCNKFETNGIYTQLFIGEKLYENPHYNFIYYDDIKKIYFGNQTFHIELDFTNKKTLSKIRNIINFS